MGGSVVVIPVFLCGGIGERLWPLSRPEFPKPFLKFGSVHSLFQQAVLRCRGSVFQSEPIIVGNLQNQKLLNDQLMEIGVDAKIIWEPLGKNSCPAIILACLEALEHHSDPILLVQACDHLITPHEAFVRSIEDAVSLASEFLVTFGVKAGEADTQFGYVVPGEFINEAFSNQAFRVNAFVEKPETEIASALLDQGAFWNSGNFLLSANIFLAEVQKLQPELYAMVLQAFGASKNRGTERFIYEGHYKALPSISVDHGIFQKTNKVAVMSVDYHWRDIGTWPAVLDLLEKKESRSETGYHCLQEAAGVFTSNQFEIRPWGEFECVAQGEGYKVKRLEVAPGQSLSLQSHKHRSEHWVIIKGTAEITLEDDVRKLGPDQSIHVPKGAVHRIRNVEEDQLVLIEVQLGDYLEEDDIVRIADEYDRLVQTE